MAVPLNQYAVGSVQWRLMLIQITKLTGKALCKNWREVGRDCSRSVPDRYYHEKPAARRLKARAETFPCLQYECDEITQRGFPMNTKTKATIEDPGMKFFEGAPVFAVDVRSENDCGSVAERDSEAGISHLLELRDVVLQCHREDDPAPGQRDLVFGHCIALGQRLNRDPSTILRSRDLAEAISPRR